MLGVNLVRRPDMDQGEQRSAPLKERTVLEPGGISHGDSGALGKAKARQSRRQYSAG
jgi:hypothetical protein